MIDSNRILEELNKNEVADEVQLREDTVSSDIAQVKGRIPSEPSEGEQGAKKKKKKKAIIEPTKEGYKLTVDDVEIDLGDDENFVKEVFGTLKGEVELSESTEKKLYEVHYKDLEID